MSEQAWRCKNPTCGVVIGIVGEDGLTIRQHARRNTSRPRIIVVSYGRIVQECYKCGEKNSLTLDDSGQAIYDTP